MAYESRIYVVEKFSMNCWDEEVKDYLACETIAEINLCRIDDDVLEKIKSYPNTDCAVWVNDARKVKDCYGDFIKMIPLKDAVKIFSYASAVHDYRRYEPCASLLRGFDPQAWGELVVLHYGY